MRRFLVAALSAGTLLAGPAPALGAPADEGNCISTRDNGGAAGDRVSSWAGPGFGALVADSLGGGALGSTARRAECRP